MIVLNKGVGLTLPGLLLVALAGCKAGQPAAAPDDHAQTVERGADAAHVQAQPAVPAQDGQVPGAVEVSRAADGSSVELRKADPAASPASPAQPVQPAH